MIIIGSKRKKLEIFSRRIQELSLPIDKMEQSKIVNYLFC